MSDDTEVYELREGHAVPKHQDECPQCAALRARVAELQKKLTAAAYDMDDMRTGEEALRAQVEELEAQLSREREDNSDIPTIAYMSGAADWKARATRAEAELAKVREASALLVGEEIQRAQKAEAERDEARRTADTLHDMLETAQEERDEARAVLLETVEQGCLGNDGKLDSMALSAYADAIRSLSKAGLVTIETDFGRRVIATVNERGQSALAECGE